MDVNEAKIVAMVSLGIGSFLVGILPAWLSPLSRQKCPLILSCLLCWGGGVLLATSLLHMLPEARESLPDNAELAFCGGFFLIYFVDELVHFFCGDGDRNVAVGRTRSRQQNHGHSHLEQSSHAYGSCETSNLLHDHRRDDPLGLGDAHTSCHVSHDEPCMQSSAGVIGLLLALLLHSVLEGLAIGLQTISAKVFLLFGAVASHKFVVGFCLGVELSATGRGSICSHIVYITIFSLGSVIGIGTGMFIEGTNELWTQTTLGVLQSLAAGTLLYVTVSEVLPRERAKWHHAKRQAGLLQLVAALIGFVFMYFMSKYLDADH